MATDQKAMLQNDIISSFKALPTCKVTFRVKLNAQLEENVRVVGSCSELGNWNPCFGVPLITQEGYPCWYTPDNVNLPIQKRVDYKYVIVDPDGKVCRWENYPENRTLVPTGLTMIVEDDHGAGRTSSLNFNALDNTIFSKQVFKPDEQQEATGTYNLNCSNLASDHTVTTYTGAGKEKQECLKNSKIDVKNTTTLLIVSFELPLKVVKDTETTTFILEKQKLLVMPQLHALKDSLQFPVKFIGWTGITTDKEQEQKEIEQLLKPHSCIPVFLQQDLLTEFLNFTHHYLWPFFHNVFMFDSKNVNHLTSKGWEAYQTLNKLYAKVIVENYQDTDLIWVHDFHLLLVAQFVTQSIRHANIGFFLHTPFPSSDIFRCFPMREEILHGMLCADVIGFHFFEYARHFLVTSKRLLNIDHHFRMGGFIEVDYGGRNIMLYIENVHLQYEDIYRIVYTNDTVEAKTQEIKERYQDKFIFASIDRCEWLSGIVLKLKGFRNFLRYYFDARHRAILIQLAYTSNNARESDVIEYVHEIKKLADEINEEFRNPLNPSELTIILEVRSVSTEEKYALYAASACFLDTSIRNGLNLNPFEFICCRKNNPAPLILSEFTGCCNTLASALRVNPWRVDDITQALDRAMTKSQEELCDRFLRDQMYIQRNSTIQWANEFLSDLQQVKKKDHLLYVGPSFGPYQRIFEIDSQLQYLDFNYVLQAFRLAKRRVFFFDHEGTLAPDRRHITTVPGFESLSSRGTPPSVAVQKYLTILCKAKKNTVVILSGRDCYLLSKWFENIPGISLCAEHGFYYKVPQITKNEWKCLSSSPEDFTWKTIATELMRHYVKRTQGSFIENKGSALVFQYRDADPDFGSWQAKELSNVLEELLSECPVTVMSGKGYVEVKLQHVNKGYAVETLLKELSDTEKIDFALCIGDDRSDEDMFPVVNSFFETTELAKLESVTTDLAKIHEDSTNISSQTKQNEIILPVACTVTVAKKPSSAQYFLNNVEEVSLLLEAFFKYELEHPS